MTDSEYTTIDDLAGLEVSLFEHKGIKNPICVKLLEAIQSFKGSLYENRITRIRLCLANEKDEEYSLLKSKLPAITFCGKFENGHKKENLATYNYLLIIDIDKLNEQELQRVKSCFHNDEYVFAFWESPSRKGLKGLMALSYDKSFTFEGPHRYHKHAFKVISEYFRQKYEIVLDISGSDISRLCFVSYDPNLELKNTFQLFSVDTSGMQEAPLVTVSPRKSDLVQSAPNLQYDKKHLNPIGKNEYKNRVEMSKIIKYLTKKKLSITSTYDNWYRVGYAIANTFSCDVGDAYYLKLCRLDGPFHDEIESKKMLIYCYDNSKGLLNFATILHLAQEQGYKRDGSEGG